MNAGWVGLLVALLLICGCATGGVDSLALHRADDAGALPGDARVGLTEFTVCGGSYLDKLGRGKQGQDERAAFYHTCTELGHPQTFSHRLRLRLEERLGRKLVPVKTDKSFKPKQVLRSAEKLGLEYVIAGDLEKARQLHLKTLKIGNAMFMESNPIPVKTALGLMGKCSDEVRLPLCPMSDANKAKLAAIMKEYKLI